MQAQEWPRLSKFSVVKNLARARKKEKEEAEEAEDRAWANQCGRLEMAICEPRHETASDGLAQISTPLHYRTGYFSPFVRWFAT